MAYSLKVDATKTNKYKEIESNVKKFFIEHGFNILPAHLLCDRDGAYLTAASVKQVYRNLPGASKQVNHSDISLMADCLMSADLFLDCGHFVAIVDITRSISCPVSYNKLLTKKRIMGLRVNRARRCKLGLKVYCPVKRQYVIKPIKTGLIIGLDYIDSLNLTPILSSLDHPSSTRFVRFFKGRSI